MHNWFINSCSLDHQANKSLCLHFLTCVRCYVISGTYTHQACSLRAELPPYQPASVREELSVHLFQFGCIKCFSYFRFILAGWLAISPRMHTQLHYLLLQCFWESPQFILIICGFFFTCMHGLLPLSPRKQTKHATHPYRLICAKAYKAFWPWPFSAGNVLFTYSDISDKRTFWECCRDKAKAKVNHHWNPWMH